MADDIYSKIRALIAEGVYIGGDTIPESELAARLGVSRTPIREAMRRLQAEGVIQREAYRRAVVVEIDPNEVIHIFTARAALEPVATGMAVAKSDAEFVDSLRDFHSRMDHAIHLPDPDRRSYRDLNAQFHRRIWKQGGNTIFANLVNLVARNPVVSPTFNSWTREELIRSNRQHDDLVSAFAADDGDWAEAAMAAHLFSSRATYRRISEEKALATSGSDSDEIDRKARRRVLVKPEEA
ncbi:GntR family transcriptional regulator [Aureimonas fodinaquatilis]|uniref:GntR family transcriptional regulator n=1 Tax=Aureimonas fodinaquatilis TaxID=2565783 RepID=A0A5B0DZ61_9HYPH|nr:GntR family transcriptional regulator [Aureimonas fodinaquatilis]KAA0971823.1 GntR family transcriptional regulator [Aureimonas fodinaquatilis]